MKGVSYKFPTIDLLDQTELHKPNIVDDIEYKKAVLEALNSIGIDDVDFEEQSIYNSYYTSVLFYVTLPNGKKNEDVIKLSNKIAFNLNINSVIVYHIEDDKFAAQIPNIYYKCERLVEYLDSIHLDNFVKKYWGNCSALLGHDFQYDTVIKDFNNLSSLIVFGSVGSGKSNLIHTILTNLLFAASPEEVKLILIDPKHVEFNVYKDLPHLLSNVIKDSKKAIKAFEWIEETIKSRYELFVNACARNIDDYNSIVKDEKLPKILVVVDELYDLIDTDKNFLNRMNKITRLSRASGVYFVFATQLFDEKIYTKEVLDNFHAIATFKLHDIKSSKFLLGNADATKLNRFGDLLFKDTMTKDIERVSVPYVSIDEINRVTDYIKQYNDVPTNRPLNDYLKEIEIEADYKSKITFAQKVLKDVDNVEDVYKALKLGIELAKDGKLLSTSQIQRFLSWGYPRAAKAFDVLVELGFMRAESKCSKLCTATEEDLKEIKDLYSIED